MRETIIVCGGAAPPEGRRQVVRLSLSGSAANVKLRLDDVSRPMVAALPPVLVDLLELAAYVYVADQLVSRGSLAARGFGADWRRDLSFIVPVRDPGRWSSPEVTKSLESLLGFMSDDNFQFYFVRARDPPAVESYFDFSNRSGKDEPADEVVSFSGGLDSLTGAVDRLETSPARLFLLSHQASTKIAERQQTLACELLRRFPGRILHVPVRITKQGVDAKETTQRTRSFLFGSLSAAVAKMAGTTQLSFYENGIVSFNLPIAGQVVGAAATRTTHPRVLHDMSEFLSLLLGAKVSVVNPYLWMTKAEVARRLKELGHADLARHTISCSRVYRITRAYTHCGCCSQCLDRRFGTLGADLGEDDPEEMYEIDLLAGGRDNELDRTMAASFVRHSLELTQLSESGFVSRFAGEMSRATTCVEGKSADEVVRETFQLHMRHANGVLSVLEEGFRRHAAALATERLPNTAILRLVAGTGGIIVPSLRSEQAPSEIDDARNFRLSSQIRLALDQPNGRILVEGLPPQVENATFHLISALISRRNEEIDQRRSPERYRYIPAKKLAADLGVTEEALRRRVLRARRNLSKEYEDCAGLVLRNDAVIESQAWKGYRLNPLVVLLAPEEIASSDERHKPPRGTSRLLTGT